MTSRDIYETGYDEENGKHVDADTCPECAGELITDGGEIRCIVCGLIVNEYRIDHGPERRIFADDETNRERTGAPLTPARHDWGLSSEIGRGVDGWGKPLSGSKRRQLGRLRIQQYRDQSKAERNLAHGFREIGRITGALGLARPIRDRACTLFREASAENLLLGRSIEAMAASSVYAACRCEGVLRTFEEIVNVAQAARSKVRNAYNVLNLELGLATKPPTPRAYLPRIASACDASTRVRERAVALVDVAESAGLANGRKPAGVAAACLYMAGHERGGLYTQAELAQIADVAAVTLKERYYELRDHLD